MKKEAKRMALLAMKQLMNEMGGKSIKDGLSVKVKASNPEALKEGLEKAKEIVGDEEGMEDSESENEGMSEELSTKEEFLKKLFEERFKK